MVPEHSRQGSPQGLELLSSKRSRYNTRPDNGRYLHNKVILINGVYQGVRSEVVYTASQNLTMTSLRESNEVMLRIETATFIGSSGLRRQLRRDQDATPCGSATSAAARTTAGVDSASETQVLRDNDPDPDE